jgi:hypothetical protein
MAHREFTDSRRINWVVWDVYPTLGDRRRSPEDRRRFMRETDERRTAGSPLRLRAEYENGWLAFESRGEKRRLAPVPEGWDQLDERGLERLCDAAVSVGRPRRLVE